MDSIVILTGGHLCNNPRVIKEATALARGGFAVEVLGAWASASLKASDQELLGRLPFKFFPVIDISESNPVAKLRRLAFRIRRKLGQWAYQIGAVPNRAQFGYASRALAGVATRRNATLLIAHSEVGLLVARGLLESGQRVGVDMEDWFSEDLLPEARKSRPIAMLRALEREILRRGAHATSPSSVMSQALAAEFGCSLPVTIYNAFPWADRQAIDGLRKDRRDPQLRSIHWYSQTIGPGRGLEDLLAALPHLEHVAEVHLRGQPVVDFNAWLSVRVPQAWRHRVFVHSLVPNEQLLSRIAEHDIGFAGEMKYCKSRDLTITNKILHYLLAGLAVVASDTAGQREVAERAQGAVLLYPSGDALALAAQLNALLGSLEKLIRAKAAALRAAEETFCWERQEQALLATVKRAIGIPLG